jgi:hypothetical protein
MSTQFSKQISFETFRYQLVVDKTLATMPQVEIQITMN